VHLLQELKLQTNDAAHSVHLSLWRALLHTPLEVALLVLWRPEDGVVVRVREELLVAELDAAFVRRERHNFDISGHYARPEILHLELDSARHRGLWKK
jgi:hypothetical protein